MFKSHFDDASTCDITVRAGEVKFCAHKIVLIAQSALFRAMFQVREPSYCICKTRLHAKYLAPGLNMLYTLQSGTKENLQEEVQLGQIEGPVLKALISFMYRCLKTVPKDLALPLFCGC